MITEKDLREAIAECQGVRHPDAKTCMMLAAYYIILDHTLNRGEEVLAYSYDPPEKQEETVKYNNDTEFSLLVDGRKISDIMPVIDELMEVLKALHPRLYAGVIQKLKQ